MGLTSWVPVDPSSRSSADRAPPPPQGFFRKRRTSNLEAYVNWFNRLSYLVATEICLVGAEAWAGAVRGRFPTY